jgi:hypothetical protein
MEKRNIEFYGFLNGQYYNDIDEFVTDCLNELSLNKSETNDCEVYCSDIATSEVSRLERPSIYETDIEYIIPEIKSIDLTKLVTADQKLDFMEKLERRLKYYDQMVCNNFDMDLHDEIFQKVESELFKLENLQESLNTFQQNISNIIGYDINSCYETNKENGKCSENCKIVDVILYCDEIKISLAALHGYYKTISNINRDILKECMLLHEIEESDLPDNLKSALKDLN